MLRDGCKQWTSIIQGSLWRRQIDIQRQKVQVRQRGRITRASSVSSTLPSCINHAGSGLVWGLFRVHSELGGLLKSGLMIGGSTVQSPAMAGEISKCCSVSVNTFEVPLSKVLNPCRSQWWGVGNWGWMLPLPPSPNRNITPVGISYLGYECLLKKTSPAFKRGWC